MLDLDYLLWIMTVSNLILLAVIVYGVTKIKKSQAETDRLRKSLEEMDAQAKLVVRTDLELNKTQEELDKKISSLYALQRLSRSMSTTLEEGQIFKMISSEYLEEMGFEKACAFMFNEKERKFNLSLNVGYSDEEIVEIKQFFDANRDAYSTLIKASGTSPENQAVRNKIKQIFRVYDFVISAIQPKEGNHGLLFVGKDSKESLITEGDEELITILANQIGQALENAHLFEKTWHAHQELENKVEDRTRELSRALEEVRRINRRKTEFVSNVSHELRTPLTSIKGYASILLAGKLGSIPEDVKNRLEKINRHSDELVQFVNDLLDIARIESGRMSMKKEPHDLKKIVEEVADLLAVQLKERQIAFSADFGKDATELLADYNQLKRVFINLINNSAKFTPAGGRISVKTARIDKNIQVDIKDTGCGMTPDEQAGLFQEFYRVDNPINQQVKGTGLGLVMVKDIVEAHKGKIWVTSKKGEGSIFSFSLPIEG